MNLLDNLEKKIEELDYEYIYADGPERQKICQHESTGQKWKRMFTDEEESWLLCEKCGEFYK